MTNTINASNTNNTNNTTDYNPMQCKDYEIFIDQVVIANGLRDLGYTELAKKCITDSRVLPTCLDILIIKAKGQQRKDIIEMLHAVGLCKTSKGTSSSRFTVAA